MLVRRKQPRAGRAVTLHLDGAPISANVGDSVAAAVIAATEGATRANPVDGAPRAPFCMMGVCFECLMTIDGAPNRQACMIPVEDGMQVKRQFGRRTLGDG